MLTKPDLIGPGNEDEVLAVLHNVRKPLQLGYVMVKNRWGALPIVVADGCWFFFFSRVGCGGLVVNGKWCGWLCCRRNSRA